MKYLLGLLFVVLLLSPSYGEDNLVLYNAGRRDPAAWSALREYFSSRNYTVSFHQGDGVIERHLEKANRINTMKSGAFVAIEILFGEEKHVMIAMADTDRVGQAEGRTEREGRRLLWAVDELPPKHEAQSKRLAELVATQFGMSIKRISLYPLTGIDMPGIFVSIQCRKEEARSLLALLDAALQKYYRRDRL